MKNKSFFSRFAAICLAVLIAVVAVSETSCSGGKKGFSGTKKNVKHRGKKGLAPGMGN